MLKCSGRLDDGGAHHRYQRGDGPRDVGVGGHQATDFVLPFFWGNCGKGCEELREQSFGPSRSPRREGHNLPAAAFRLHEVGGQEGNYGGLAAAPGPLKSVDDAGLNTMVLRDELGSALRHGRATESVLLHPLDRIVTPALPRQWLVW